MGDGTKVGLLFIGTILALVAFLSFLGVLQPFQDTHQLNIAYNFAGGIEVGSPIRVMGIKVGKVKRIVFQPDQKVGDEEVKLKIEVQIQKKAWSSIREDSQFYINLAGVIGEKYIEVSPGSSDRSELKPGSLIRGEDPPRIDQMISQGYALAGKILKMVEENESSVVGMIDSLNGLLKNMNKTMKMMEDLTGNRKYSRIVNNVAKLTDDMVSLSGYVQSSDIKKSRELIKRLIWRLDELDKHAIKKFFQEEGVKARVAL